jgi:hypothetical protein
VATAREHPQRHLEGRVELVQMPAQTLMRPPPLIDEIVAVIDEQLQLTKRLFVGPRPAQLRLAQRRPRNGERVDRVGLAAALPARRSGAISFGGTRTNCSPAASSCRSSHRVNCRQSSSATTAPRKARAPWQAAPRSRSPSSSRRAISRPR